MRAFAQAWPETEFVQQAAAQLPWFHLCTLIDKLKKREERDWYLARKSLKDPYRFDFLGLSDAAQEREVEQALVQQVTRFLLELGAGFAFVGRQVLLGVGDDEFFIDLLFCHCSRLWSHSMFGLSEPPDVRDNGATSCSSLWSHPMFGSMERTTR